VDESKVAIVAGKPIKLRTFSRSELKDALEDYINSHLNDGLQEFLTKITNQPEDDFELRTWLISLTGRLDELELAVLKHWMWGVKRKALGKPVVYHIMPVLFGPQGTGKSEAIHRLLEPWKDYKLSMALNELSDSRHFKSFSCNYVYFADELQNIEKTSMNVLKNQITARENSYRALYTNNTTTVPQAAHLSVLVIAESMRWYLMLPACVDSMKYKYLVLPTDQASTFQLWQCGKVLTRI